ncbi:glycosyltransferase family 2 protein [Ochrobactrum pecoris]|uniref:Glycosyltransferase family 2 protein n=1 Tax=Brucella pecoris TaxID=867683 RepID=A0A5C5CJR8_9HYPH|nr:glycosyltransferase family 2 protein [Brucella pecoris]MBB4091641.1 glycosyltransferase involved in cell wall biosynthesis [Brucella pecoris]NKW82478.1 glycosyltransferase family 2 protein [Brucella pecoris]TNV11729.1 glycosyltransferase family 2 protein [Brucella pecoris]
MNVSVLIMTLNEEVNLPACLASLDWCDDIVILDSYSSDRTVEIAKAAGARVFQRAYDTEDRQRMYGITEIKFKHDWVYTPDADEITPPDLRDEMLAIASDPKRPEVFFKARYKNMFMGRWIRHASLYPTWITRLVRPDRVRFERSVHSRASGGPEGALQAHFIHYSFNKGLEAWYDKHNRYSSAEADLSASRLLERKIDWGGILSTVPERRRRALKSLSYHMPFRPGLRFLYMYLLRGGFLDGKPGYLYCRLLSAYEFMIIVKTEEQRQRQSALHGNSPSARRSLEAEAPERRLT